MENSSHFHPQSLSLIEMDGQLPDLPSTPSRRSRQRDERSREECRIDHKLWSKFCSKVNFGLLSPFSIFLASGNLKPDGFARFVSHDDEFFKAFDSELRAAEDNASDDKNARTALSELREDIKKAQAKHKSLVKELVPNDTVDTDIPPATKRYIDFLMRIATVPCEENEHEPNDAEKKRRKKKKRKHRAYVVAALAASLRMCAFLGTELEGVIDPRSDTHCYRNWTGFYAADSFQAMAKKVEDLLHRLYASLPLNEHGGLGHVYKSSINHGVNVITEQFISQPSVAPLIGCKEDRLIFFCNFDFTCSPLNSSDQLVQLAIRVTTPKTLYDKYEGRNIKFSADRMGRRWKTIKENHKIGYQREVKRILKERTKKDKEFNYEYVVTSLNRLSRFDKDANNEILESGILNGLSMDHLILAGSILPLYRGCADFFQALPGNNAKEVETHIISYGLSTHLISNKFSPVCNVKVHANDIIDTMSPVISPVFRRLTKQVESPIDKVKKMREITKKAPSDKKSLRVFVGHSVNDLLCLLEADIGIVFNCDPNLALIGESLRVTFVPLFKGLVKKQRELKHGDTLTTWNSKKGVLYTVTSWDEIHAFILGTLGCKRN